MPNAYCKSMTRRGAIKLSAVLLFALTSEAAFSQQQTNTWIDKFGREDPVNSNSSRASSNMCVNKQGQSCLSTRLSGPHAYGDITFQYHLYAAEIQNRCESSVTLNIRARRTDGAPQGLAGPRPIAPGEIFKVECPSEHPNNSNFNWYCTGEWQIWSTCEASQQAATRTPDRPATPGARQQNQSSSSGTQQRHAESLFESALGRSVTELESSREAYRARFESAMRRNLEAARADSASSNLLPLLEVISMGLAAYNAANIASYRAPTMQPNPYQSGSSAGGAVGSNAQNCNALAAEGSSAVNSISDPDPCRRLQRVLAVTQSTYNRARAICPREAVFLEGQVRELSAYVSSPSGVCRGR
jgi:hypothetical protein